MEAQSVPIWKIGGILIIICSIVIRCFFFFFVFLCRSRKIMEWTTTKKKKLTKINKPYFYWFWIPPPPPPPHSTRNSGSARRGFHGHNGTAVIVQPPSLWCYYYILHFIYIFVKYNIMFNGIYHYIGHIYTRHDRVFLVKMYMHAQSNSINNSSSSFSTPIPRDFGTDRNALYTINIHNEFY